MFSHPTSCMRRSLLVPFIAPDTILATSYCTCFHWPYNRLKIRVRIFITGRISDLYNLHTVSLLTLNLRPLSMLSFSFATSMYIQGVFISLYVWLSFITVPAAWDITAKGMCHWKVNAFLTHCFANKTCWNANHSFGFQVSSDFPNIQQGCNKRGFGSVAIPTLSVGRLTYVFLATVFRLPYHKPRWSTALEIIKNALTVPRHAPPTAALRNYWLHPCPVLPDCSKQNQPKP